MFSSVICIHNVQQTSRNAYRVLHSPPSKQLVHACNDRTQQSSLFMHAMTGMAHKLAQCCRVSGKVTLTMGASSAAAAVAYLMRLVQLSNAQDAASLQSKQNIVGPADTRDTNPQKNCSCTDRHCYFAPCLVENIPGGSEAVIAQWSPK